MGRSVYADEAVEAYIQELIKKRQWYIGLILGQSAAQKDFVLCLAKTPEEAVDEVCEESEIGQTEELPSNNKRKRRQTRAKSLDAADEQWVATHAKQVTRMLPGGLEVIGLFAVAPTNMLKDSQAKLRQIIFATQKLVMKNMPSLPADEATERIILQVDSLTSKVTCSSIDVSNAKSALRPAEWRYSGSNKWTRLDSSVAVDVTLPVASEHLSLLKCMQQAIFPFCQDVLKSEALINGEMREESETLSAGTESRKKKGRDTEAVPQEIYLLDFLLPLADSTLAEDAKVLEMGKVVSVRGIIVCRAFVHWKATVGEAVEAMKEDILRTLVARCELLSEDLELTDEISVVESRQLHDTPVRVFIPALGVQLCDYKFQDEKKEEVTSRVKELTDITVLAESLEVNCEHPARDCDWVAASHSEHSISSLNSMGSDTQDKKSNSTLYISLAISGVAAAAAAILSYLSMDDGH